MATGQILSEADQHDMEQELAQGRRLRGQLEENERRYGHLQYDREKRRMLYRCTQFAPACPNCVITALLKDAEDQATRGAAWTMVHGWSAA